MAIAIALQRGAGGLSIISFYSYVRSPSKRGIPNGCIYSQHLIAMLAPALVDPSFPVPDQIASDAFRLRMLTIHDLIKDYDAVMSSIERLTTVFGDESGWPRNLTLEQDLIDLAWHHKEFQRRTSFAYTVMSLDEQVCLGCVYIMPPERGHRDASASEATGYDAAVYLWVRDSAYETGMDSLLFEFTKQWIATAWPFQCVAYPGRDIPWDEWKTLP